LRGLGDRWGRLGITGGGFVAAASMSA
jgi:hypothetical protein